MEKAKLIKAVSCEDQKTKQKLAANKQIANQKPTLAIRNKKNNELVTKLICQSEIISEQSSITVSEEDSVQEIDSLYVEGTIQNVAEFDDHYKKKYGYSYGLVFQVDDYIIVFPGRHQVNFRSGIPVGLYVPNASKSQRDPKTKKIQVFVERKLRDQSTKDPMQYPYIVVDPKNSIYPTYICSWLECKRKITLQHYISYEQETNECLIYGNAIHRYLQWLIRKQVLPQDPTEKEMKKLYDSFLYQMYLIDIGFDMFVEKVENGIVNLVSWYEAHIVKGKVIELNKYQKRYLKITRTIGSEVMLKSKYFGIRGKMDGLLEGVYSDQKLGQSYTVAVPFELKTGVKVLDSHKKQVQFYNFLVRENKKMPVIGLLYYSDSNLIQHRVQNPLICFENINCHRNRIMINILNLYCESQKINLPCLPETFDQCRLCDVSIECGVARLQPEKILDLEDIGDNTPENYNVDLRQKLKKITVLQMQYLKKWINFLHLEECAQRKQSKLNEQKYYHRKIRINVTQLQKFNNYQPGDMLTIKIHKLIENHEMSEELDNYFRVGQKLRIFIPIIRVADACRISSVWKNTKKFQMQVQIKNDNIKFNREKCRLLFDVQNIPHVEVQLERYENSFYNYTRGYCFKFVMLAQKWLKDIVINETYEPFNKKKILCSEIPQLQKLNQNQKQAFVKCLQMERFCLVQGMPGTGKTQLIIKLIEYFYRENKTILVTSFNNQALTNILDREVNEHKVISPEHIIRQGSRYGISSQFSFLSSQGQSFESVEHYKQFFKKKRVWFVTISSLYIHHLPKKFDLVIVDEASQCLEANCLEALIKADKFMLIGDQRQLQPLVKSKQAVELGMQVSLFEKLCNKYKAMTVKLRKQYRMSPSIMNLTNKLVYNGQLQLGQPQMAGRKLKIPQKWKTVVPPHLHEIIDPQNSLRFVNYDSALNLFSDGDTVDIRRVKRLLQIRITCSLYRWFRQLGIAKQNILIISAYNSIVHQLVLALKKQRLIEQNNSDVLTIDKSQGSDKQIIIFIFNKGNKQLIQNYRRLNVALTRAKNKFIIVGSHQELSELATWTGRLAQLLLPDTINIDKDFLTATLDEYDVSTKSIRSQPLKQKQQA